MKSSFNPLPAQIAGAILIAVILTGIVVYVITRNTDVSGIFAGIAEIVAMALAISLIAGSMMGRNARLQQFENAYGIDQENILSHSDDAMALIESGNDIHVATLTYASKANKVVRYMVRIDSQNHLRLIQLDKGSAGTVVKPHAGE